jgi:hypothetical protein
MGFRIHATLKCHTCKSRRALGGSKKTGTYDAAERSGWRSTVTKSGDYVWLCPPCARKMGK